MVYEIILQGRVQGVCCRHYCSQVGRAMKISGSATNLADGNVRVLVQASTMERVEKYITALRNNSYGYHFYGVITGYTIDQWHGSMDGDYTW